MRAPIKSTIFQWRNKAKQGTRTKRYLEAYIRRKNQRIARLEEQNAALQKQLQPTRIYGHTYPAEMICLAVFMVIAGCSYRASARTLGFYAKLMGWNFKAPSHTNVRNWVLRCGYGSMQQTAQRSSGDFVAIVDESIQIGKEKLLLILGYPLLKDQCRTQALKHADVQVLGMSMRSSWAGEKIAEFVQDRLTKLNSVNLVRVISDQGSNLLNAWSRLGLQHVSDCTHMMMNQVKELFGSDSELDELCRQIGKLRQRWAMTDYACFLPPTMRDKDRFCRIFHLLDWLDRIDAYWNQLSATEKQHLAFTRSVAWLRRRCSQVRQLVELTAQVLKKRGLSETSHQYWQQQISKYLDKQPVVTQQARSFIKGVEAYFQSHAHIYADQDQVLCCSDVIESIFGRYKNKGGMKVMSADILSIALYRQEITVDFVRQMLGNVSEQEVRQWEIENVYENRYGVIRRLNRELKSVA